MQILVTRSEEEVRRRVERVEEGRRQGSKQISVSVRGRLSLGCLGVETPWYFVTPDPESSLRLIVFSKLPALPLGY